MNKFILVLILAALFAVTLAADEKKSDVVTLTKKNYDEVLKKNEFVLVEYYAPWCGHCKALAPEYEKAATALKDLKNVVIAKVDADKERELGEKAGIQGFPTLKLYKNGKLAKDYDGGRTSDAIVSWIKKKTGPVATLVKNQAELDAFLKANPKALVGFFASKDDAEYKKFLKNADEDKIFGDFPAAEVFDKELAKAAVGGVVPSLKLFRDFDKKALVLSGEELKDAKKWLLGNGYPLVEEIGAENFQRYVDSGLKLAVAFINKKEDTKALLKTLNEVAEKVKGKISWGWSDGVLYKDQIDAMGADSSKLPAFAAMDIHKRLNYPYKGEVTVDALTKWSQGVADGSIKPFYKSQPVPKEQKEAVVVVVGKSFNDVVMDKTKDVLLEFYAPWCGHCKSLAPKYLKLAEELKSNKNLVIAKIDATENDTPIQIEGFPTLYFFPSNNKDKPVSYNGARTVAAMKKFLKENAVASKDGFPAEKKEKKPEKKDEKKPKKDEL